MCFVYHRLHYQLASSELIVSRKIEEGHRKEAPLLDEPGWAQEKKFHGWLGSARHQRPVSCVCSGLTKLSQTCAHRSDGAGSHHLNALYCSQGRVPGAQSQSGCRLKASGAAQAAEIKLSQPYSSRWKRKPRRVLGLDARKRIPGHATGDSIRVLKGKLE